MPAILFIGNMTPPPDSFMKFFHQIYGDRWADLYEALRSEETRYPRQSAFAGKLKEGDGGRNPRRGSTGLLAEYFMDPACVFVAKALDVQKGDRVLDMCAAPGGKTLILAEALPGELIANEISKARRDRLKKVIQQYLPRSMRERTIVTGRDGGQFALIKPGYFDRILVDVPCSGERHLLRNKIELSLWSEARTKRLAQRQYALVTAALMASRPGGRIVYSTCSLSPYENDGVIDRLHKKKKGYFAVDKSHSPGNSEAEETKNGWAFLPDRSGWGPIYYAVLQKPIECSSEDPLDQ